MSGCKPVACLNKKEAKHPDRQTFYKFIKNFLSEVPGVACPKAGKGAYSNAISISNDTSDDVIVASSFLAFHSVLKDSQDYTAAIRWSRLLADVSDAVAEWNDGFVRSTNCSFCRRI